MVIVTTVPPISLLGKISLHAVVWLRHYTPQCCSNIHQSAKAQRWCAAPATLSRKRLLSSWKITHHLLCRQYLIFLAVESKADNQSFAGNAGFVSTPHPLHPNCESGPNHFPPNLFFSRARQAQNFATAIAASASRCQLHYIDRWPWQGCQGCGNEPKCADPNADPNWTQMCGPKSPP